MMPEDYVSMERRNLHSCVAYGFSTIKWWIVLIFIFNLRKCVQYSNAFIFAKKQKCAIKHLLIQNVEDIHLKDIYLHQQP